MATHQARAQDRTLCVHDVAPGQHLNMRAAPNLTGAVITRLASETCDIKLVGRCEGDWCEMAYGNFRGWIDTRYIGVFEYPPQTAASAQSSRTTADPANAAVPEPAEVAANPPSDSAKQIVEKPQAKTAHRRPARSQRKVSRPRPQKKLRRADRFADLEPNRPRSSSACVTRVEGWDTLRIRSGPGIAYREIGRIPPSSCGVHPAGNCRGAWCQVGWRGQVGWVNAYYLEQGHRPMPRPRWWGSWVLAFCRF
ncbi:MAG: SH3 domain-containing protein [Hyphomicrobiaceae bacterium]